MLYPRDIEEKIGFDKIRQLLKNHCISTRLALVAFLSVRAVSTRLTLEFAEVHPAILRVAP